MDRIALIIAGPTCSGKTKLSLQIARRIKSEIISADSRQIYQQLNIGTAKPNVEELQLVKHHFINLLKCDEDYNVSRFERDAMLIIEKLFSQNKLPVIVGGSGLYIKSIVDGIFDIADPAPEIRSELIEIKNSKGNEFLYSYLKSIDPLSAETMLPQNWKRVIRAIEVLRLTGQSILQFHQNQKKESSIKFFQYGLFWRRDMLYENIEKRVDLMIEKGLVKEVENILQQGIPASLNSLNTVGYKEIISYLNKEISLEKAVELIKRNTRRYAKRQMTWFRKDTRIKWIDVENEKALGNIADQIISEINGE